jgi:hypothetical protein
MRPDEFVPEGRWIGLVIAVRRPFRTRDRFGRCQPLRSWLISAVAPRPNRTIEWLSFQTLKGWDEGEQLFAPKRHNLIHQKKSVVHPSTPTLKNQR